MYIHVDMRRYSMTLRIVNGTFHLYFVVWTASSMTLRIVNGTFHLYFVVWTASDLDLVEGYELEAIRYLTGREGSSPVVFADVHEEVRMGTDRPLLR